jgi:osmotically-inducible protein OsmY
MSSSNNEQTRCLQTIRERLENDPDIRGKELEVSIENGVVVLAGAVATRQVRDDVEALVRACCGKTIKDIENRLDVEHAQTDVPR